MQRGYNLDKFENLSSVTIHIVAFFLLLLGGAFSFVLAQGSITIQPARATWESGYFQEALLRRALVDLGYQVKPPKELMNSLFYQSVTQGAVHYWPHGWFPEHASQAPPQFAQKAGLYGSVTGQSDAFQGYFISKWVVERYKLRTLEDLKTNREARLALDRNGDGKADLVGCTVGWGCAKAIAAHIKLYRLENVINVTTASYAASMAAALAHAERKTASQPNGGAILGFFFNPHWVVHALDLGNKTLAIGFKENKPTPEQISKKDKMRVQVPWGVNASASDPYLYAGFIRNEIRIVASRVFIENNPRVKVLFEAFRVPLADINLQNWRMRQGERSQKDINRHVTEWIQKNRSTYNSWLQAARAVK